MNLKHIKWQSFESQASLDQAAMEKVIALAESSIKTRGQFHIVLAGGSTPKNVYTLLKNIKTDWCDRDDQGQLKPHFSDQFHCHLLI